MKPIPHRFLMRCDVQEEKVGEMIAEGTPEVVDSACAQICEDSGSSKKKKKQKKKKQKKKHTKKTKPEL